MDEGAIIHYITHTFSGVDLYTGSEADGIAAGDSFFFYDPERKLDPKRRHPFATIVTKDYGDFDKASNLDRPGVFRLNIGVSHDTFRSLFGEADADRDYSVLDQLMPHPVYARQSWVSVLNPSEQTFETLRPLLEEAHGLAVRRVK